MSTDETEIGAYKFAVRAAGEDHPAGDPQALFGGGEDPHRPGWPAWRVQYCRVCRREGIAEGLYYSWSKEFLEAGKRRLAGDTARAATSSEGRTFAVRHGP
jgi:hypothetical protein